MMTSDAPGTTTCMAHVASPSEIQGCTLMEASGLPVSRC